MHAIKPHDVIKSEQLIKTGLQGPNTHSCISKLANNTKGGLFSQNDKQNMAGRCGLPPNKSFSKFLD